MSQYYPETINVNQLRYGNIIFYNNMLYSYQHIQHYWNSLELGVKPYPDPDDNTPYENNLKHLTTQTIYIKLDTEFVVKLMTDQDYININIANINKQIDELTTENKILEKNCEDYNNIIQMNINNGFTNNKKITQKITEYEENIVKNIVTINRLNDELLIILV